MKDFFTCYFAALFFLKAFGIGEDKEEQEQEQQQERDKYRCTGFLKGYF